MGGMLGDARCNPNVANEIHAAPNEHEALRREVRNLRRFRQARCEPRLDGMAVRRRNVEWLSGQLTPDMARNDLAGDIVAQDVALDRQHDGTRDHRAEHCGCSQRPQRPASMTETSHLSRTSRPALTNRLQPPPYS